MTYCDLHLYEYICILKHYQCLCKYLYTPIHPIKLIYLYNPINPTALIQTFPFFTIDTLYSIVIYQFF